MVPCLFPPCDRPSLYRAIHDRDLGWHLWNRDFCAKWKHHVMHEDVESVTLHDTLETTSTCDGTDIDRLAGTKWTAES